MSSALELPPIEPLSGTIQINEIMAVTERLTQLLKTESGYLKEMRVAPVAALQQEKNALISWLEAQKKIIALRPEMLESIDDNWRQSFAEASQQFARAAEENYHQTAIARLINQRIVQSITESLREQQTVGTYSAQGTTQPGKQSALSFNLNQKA